MDIANYTTHLYDYYTQIWGKPEPYLIGFCGSLIPFKYRKCVFENIQHNILRKGKIILWKCVCVDI